MWTETTRRQCRRDDLRYASDMTDAEWALIELHLPAAKRLGRPRCVPLRAVVEALLYLLRTGPCCTDGAHRRGDANPVWGYEIRT